jgi:hypothetical protein
VTALPVSDEEDKEKGASDDLALKETGTDGGIVHVCRALLLLRATGSC